jgi:hypothetical protein
MLNLTLKNNTRKYRNIFKNYSLKTNILWSQQLSKQNPQTKSKYTYQHFFVMSLCLCYLWDAYEIIAQVRCLVVGFLNTLSGDPKCKNTFLIPLWKKVKTLFTALQPKIISIFVSQNCTLILKCMLCNTLIMPQKCLF